MRLLTKKSTWLLLVFIGIFLLSACSPGALTPTFESANVSSSPHPTDIETIASPVPTEAMATEAEATSTLIPTKPANDRTLADVVSVTANGSEDSYTFAVEIRSPDTGCEQYADWWEVITEDGELIYRRTLTHSHVNEQPFTRSGGPVMINPEVVVIVRAHMYPTGYGGTAFQGSVNGYFEEIQLDPNFATELENADPLPDGCAF